MALPGSMYVYQGDELGLPEVEDIPAERRQDPMWFRSGGVDPGRDGCRVPMPWSGDRPPYGFSADGSARPWLDQPDDWARAHRRGAESGDPGSMLSLYRAGLRLRRDVALERATRRSAGFPPTDDVLAFARGDGFVCLVNFGPNRSRCRGSRRPHRKRRARRRCCSRRTRRSGSASASNGHAIGQDNDQGGTMKSTRVATTVAAAGLLAVLAGCGLEHGGRLDAREQDGHDQRRIADPGQHQARRCSSSTHQVAQFEKANPTIKVKSVEYQWTAPTFAAKLAAGTLPTVFEVPFTDARSLGDNGQLADLTRYVKALPYFSKYNPAVLAEGTTAKGKIVALPKGAYAQALHYNRKLFKEAGLDPNKPPTTWAQVRADAKAIAQKTGKAGYVQMAKDDNTAGWILTTARLRPRRPDGDRHRHEGEGDARQPADRRRR